jgi:hypothetical protein
VFLWWPKDLHDAGQLLLFILAREDRISSVKLGQNTTQTPHVNRQSIRHSENDFWGAVESRLDVSVDFLVLVAARSEINNLDLRACRMGKKDIFRLEITVNDALFLEQDETAEQLLRKASNKLQREAAEVVGLDKFVKIHS